jgi:putative tricarboxylic transport membrane protein
MSIGRDGIAGLILLAISLVLLVKSFQLPSLPIVPVGPGFYPAIVLSFMAAASALLVLQDLLKRRPAGAGDAPRRNYRLVLIAFAIVGGYVLLLPLVGFRVATVLFVGALQAALGRPQTARQWGVLAAIALGTAAASYFVFEHYLLVLLPRGAWTGF